MSPLGPYVTLPDALDKPNIYVLVEPLQSFFFRDCRVLRSDGGQLGAKQVWEDRIW